MEHVARLLRNILLNHPKISNATRARTPPRPSNLHVSEIPHALRVFASRIA